MVLLKYAYNIRSIA